MKMRTKRILTEEVAPFIPPLLFVMVWFLFGCSIPKQATDLMAGGLAFASIAGGFLVTAWSIILSASNRKIIKKLITSPVYFSRFNRFFRHAIYSMLMLIIVSMLGFFWEESRPQMLLFIFVFSTSATLAFRFGYFVYHVMNNAVSNPADQI